MKKKLLVMLGAMMCVGCLSAQTDVGESITSPRKDVKKAVSESNTLLQKMDTREAKFKMEEQQAPVVLSYVGGYIRGGKVSITDLLANPFIRAASNDTTATDLHWKIKSYNVIFNSKGWDEPPLTCMGSSFSDKVKEKISRATPGTVIVFTDIEASCETGEQTLDEIIVLLK